MSTSCQNSQQIKYMYVCILKVGACVFNIVYKMQKQNTYEQNERNNVNDLFENKLPLSISTCYIITIKTMKNNLSLSICSF